MGGVNVIALWVESMYGYYKLFYPRKNSYHLHLFKHLIPISSAWAQLCMPMGLERQSISRISVPAQRTSSKKIWPTPSGIDGPIKVTGAALHILCLLIIHGLLLSQSTMIHHLLLS